MMLTQWIQQFRQPGHEYRGKPFWAWNGELEADEIVRQIHVLKAMGMGGAFLHSRVGLRTRYMGDQWFDITRRAIDEMVELGLEPWLYDEDRWPSGYAGGLATRDPANRIQFLIMEIIPARDYRPDDAFFALWAGHVNGRSSRNLRRLEPGRPLDSTKGSVLGFRIGTMPECEWFNGETYLNVMSEQAVSAFLDTTHEAYREKLGDARFGQVEGIFTDEPSYCMFIPGQIPAPRNEFRYAFAPWTGDLAERFREARGYDLMECLPSLFLDNEQAEVARHRVDYRNVCTELFVNRFTRRIHEWCTGHQWKLTGHVLFEEPMHNQVMAVGAAMRHYEYMQYPGMDLLTQFFHEYDTAKQVQSIKHQFRKRFMLSEMYGCTGWDFGMEGHKALGDWQAALGVNLRCHHLSWYTMAGEAKRDYPASVFFQSPWFERYGHVEDYFSRIHVALDQGRAVQKVGVLHPIESMFARYRPPILNNGEQDKGLMHVPPADILEVNEMLKTVRDWLLDAHLDFDYIDEDILARHGRVETVEGSPALGVAEAAYETIVVPPVDVIRASTLGLLSDFHARGGRVVALGKAIDVMRRAEPGDGKWLDDITSCPFEAGPVVGQVEAGARVVSLADASGKEVGALIYQLRRTDSGHVLFVCNRDRKAPRDGVTVRIRAEGQAHELIPEDGTGVSLPSRREEDALVFETRFEPSGSRLFLITDEPQDWPAADADRWELVGTNKITIPPEVTPCEENVAVLDMARWRIGGDKGWGNTEEILRIDRRIRKRLGWPVRGGSMVQPWAATTERKGPPLALQFAFELTEDEIGEVDLVIEQPERWMIRLNGQAVPNTTDRFWIDTALRRLSLPGGALRPGPNTLEIETEFRDTTDLEALYLVGDFGVRVSGTVPVLYGAPTTLRHGDWTKQGYPFYGGALTYTYRVDPARECVNGEAGRFVLNFEDFNATMLHVTVNGTTSRTLAWPPYQVDLTREVKKGGPLEIAVQVYGSRRNTFGPLHQRDPNPEWVGPGNFVTEDDDWCDLHQLKACGLHREPEIQMFMRVVD